MEMICNKADRCTNTVMFLVCPHRKPHKHTEFINCVDDCSTGGHCIPLPSTEPAKEKPLLLSEEEHHYQLIRETQQETARQIFEEAEKDCPHKHPYKNPTYGWQKRDCIVCWRELKSRFMEGK